MSYFRDKLKGILLVKDTPHRIAMAFAVGVFMGISPLLGLHYIGGFFLAWLFRLNKLVTLVGVSVNNPWTIVPISSFSVWIGAKLIGIKQILPEVDWKSVTLTKIAGKMADMNSFIYLLKKLMPLLAAFFVGSLVICIISAVASYFIIHMLATKYHKTHGAA
ncbi:MAG: DUF2062 domain-containing protein [Nitrospirae bacterium]|nr:DUF2062 domain-containing protein [Nitrospirota bacterium]